MRRNRTLPGLLTSIISLLIACEDTPQNHGGGNDNGEFTYDVEEAFPGLTFNNAVDLQTAGDRTGRLFVVEQAGVIRVFDPANPTGSQVFMDISARVASGGERGLLSLVFDPDFTSNRFFYVYYTPRSGTVAQLSRFSANPGKATGNPGSEKFVLSVNQPAVNHNGGQIIFDNHGYLLLSLGDGGGGGDPDDNGQDLTTLLGAVLRIDVNTLPYTIPSSNPFVGAGSGTREEIYAYGLRNPWRMSFDPVTQRIWVGDVGQGRYEEVNVITYGGNYGWDCREGAHVYDADGTDPGTRSSACLTATGLIDPVWEYGRTQGSVVTGGYVDRGPTLTSLVGKYLCADHGSGRIWAVTYDGISGTAEELIDTALRISSFGVGEDGEVYFLHRDIRGGVYRITQTEVPEP